MGWRGGGDTAEALVKELMPIKSLARLIGANHTSSVQEDVQYFIARWSEEGYSIILGIIKLNPSMSKQEKAESNEMVTNTFEIHKSFWGGEHEQAGPNSEVFTGVSANIFESADLMIRSNDSKSNRSATTATRRLSTYFT